MIVYMLLQEVYEYDMDKTIYGIYTTKEKAEKQRKRIVQKLIRDGKNLHKKLLKFKKTKKGYESVPEDWETFYTNSPWECKNEIDSLIIEEWKLDKKFGGTYNG